MAHCPCGCPNPVCLAVDAPISIATADSCDTIGLNLLDGDSIDWGLGSAGALTATAIASADDGNVLEIRDNGIFVPQLAFAVRGTGVSWLENKVDRTARHTVTLELPEGEWFVFAQWEAWIQKDNTEVSETNASIQHRMVINDQRQPIRRWQWGQSSGVLGTPADDTALKANSASIGDSAGDRVFAEGRLTKIDISVETSRTPPGPQNNVNVYGSFISAVAVRQ